MKRVGHHQELVLTSANRKCWRTRAGAPGTGSRARSRRAGQGAHQRQGQQRDGHVTSTEASGHSTGRVAGALSSGAKSGPSTPRRAAKPSRSSRLKPSTAVAIRPSRFTRKSVGTTSRPSAAASGIRIRFEQDGQSRPSSARGRRRVSGRPAGPRGPWTSRPPPVDAVHEGQGQARGLAVAVADEDERGAPAHAADSGRSAAGEGRAATGAGTVRTGALAPQAATKSRPPRCGMTPAAWPRSSSFCTARRPRSPQSRVISFTHMPDEAVGDPRVHAAREVHRVVERVRADAPASSARSRARGR